MSGLGGVGLAVFSSNLVALSTQASAEEVASVAPAIGTISRTQIRRLQRLHSKACYLQCKSKLLDVVRPMPQSTVYSEVVNVADLELPLLKSSGHNCNWCGILTPLHPSPIALRPVADQSEDNMVLDCTVTQQD